MAWPPPPVEDVGIRAIGQRFRADRHGNLLGTEIVGPPVHSTTVTIDALLEEESLDDSLWEDLEWVAFPLRVTPQALKVARDKEVNKLTEFECYKWTTRAGALGGRWITSRWEDQARDGGETARSRWVLRGFRSADGPAGVLRASPAGRLGGAAPRLRGLQ